jgi:hypothetical protein
MKAFDSRMVSAEVVGNQIVSAGFYILPIDVDFDSQIVTVGGFYQHIVAILGVPLLRN